MKLPTIREQFARIGARVMVEPARELFRAAQAVRIEVRRDHRGEFFHVMVDPLRILALEMIAVRPADHYLIMLVRQREFGQMREAPRRIFVCGRQGSSLLVRDEVQPPVQKREGRVLASMKSVRWRKHERGLLPRHGAKRAPQDQIAHQGRRNEVRLRTRSEATLSRQ